jgi:hypothetical protein
VTRLRQIMLEELRRRHYAESTIQIYIHTVEHFSRHFHRSPDQLGPEQIRQYQAALFTRWKLAPNTVIQRLAALRFFYVQVLKRGWSVAETPYPKKVLHLPQVLSQEEVARLIDAAELPFHRILLMTLYATGARRAEVAHLKISDIDSQRMVIHIRGGKGRKDRDVMLSPKRSRHCASTGAGFGGEQNFFQSVSGYSSNPINQQQAPPRRPRCPFTRCGNVRFAAEPCKSSSASRPRNFCSDLRLISAGAPLESTSAASNLARAMARILVLCLAFLTMQYGCALQTLRCAAS